MGFLCIFLGHSHESLELILAVLGGVLLVNAYWLNAKLKHRKMACEC
jgi:hypothetical protein